MAKKATQKRPPQPKERCVNPRCGKILTKKEEWEYGRYCTKCFSERGAQHWPSTSLSPLETAWFAQRPAPYPSWCGTGSSFYLESSSTLLSSSAILSSSDLWWMINFLTQGQIRSPIKTSKRKIKKSSNSQWALSLSRVQKVSYSILFKSSWHYTTKFKEKGRELWATRPRRLTQVLFWL